MSISSIEAEKRHLRGVEAFHLSKGWKGIAYNYAPSYVKPGTAYELRGIYRSNAANGTRTNNDNLPAFYMMQGGDQSPTVTAVINLLDLFEKLAADHGMQDDKILGHRDVRSTTCPGPKIYAAIQQLNRGETPDWLAPGLDEASEVFVLGAGDGYTVRPWLQTVVLQAQAKLAHLGYMTGDEVDGRYGPITEAAVIEFQKALGLKVDGLLGHATDVALDLEYVNSDLPVTNPDTPTGPEKELQALRKQAHWQNQELKRLNEVITRARAELNVPLPPTE